MSFSFSLSSFFIIESNNCWKKTEKIMNGLNTTIFFSHRCTDLSFAHPQLISIHKRNTGKLFLEHPIHQVMKNLAASEVWCKLANWIHSKRHTLDICEPCPISYHSFLHQWSSFSYITLLFWVNVMTFLIKWELLALTDISLIWCLTSSTCGSFLNLVRPLLWL